MPDVRRLLLLSLLIVSLLASPAVLAGCMQKDPNVVVVATNARYKPFEFIDPETQEIVGFDIDLFKEVAKRAGLKLEFTNVPFTTIIAGVESEQYDAAIACITITEERAQKVLFSVPYNQASQVITVREDDADIDGAAYLSEHKPLIGAQTATTGYNEAVKLVGKEQVKEYQDIDLAFQALAGQTIDAVIADSPLTADFVAKNEGYRVVGEPLSKEEYGIAVPKSRAALMEKINAALKEILEDGTIDKLKEKWDVQ